MVLNIGANISNNNRNIFLIDTFLASMKCPLFCKSYFQNYVLFKLITLKWYKSEFKNQIFVCAGVEITTVPIPNNLTRPATNKPGRQTVQTDPCRLADPCRQTVRADHSAQSQYIISGRIDYRLLTILDFDTVNYSKKTGLL